MRHSELSQKCQDALEDPRVRVYQSNEFHYLMAFLPDQESSARRVGRYISQVLHYNHIVVVQKDTVTLWIRESQQKKPLAEKYTRGRCEACPSAS